MNLPFGKKKKAILEECCKTKTKMKIESIRPRPRLLDIVLVLIFTIFITFTCNLEWPKIKNELFTYQKSSDEHDLIAWVFDQKFKKLIDFISMFDVWKDVYGRMTKERFTTHNLLLLKFDYNTWISSHKCWNTRKLTRSFASWYYN